MFWSTTEQGNDYAPPDIIRSLLDHYRIDPKADLLISPPFRGPDKRWYAILSRPMRGQGATVQGLAGGAIALNYFEEFYRAVELSEEWFDQPAPERRDFAGALSA